MIANADSAVATQPAIDVNPMGIIQSIDPLMVGFNESDEELSTSQDFPNWPCKTGLDYKISFNNFVSKANLPLNSQDLLRIKRKIMDKINALKNSPYANLLAGPCLPIIRPQIEIRYYEDMVHFYWQKINGNFCHKANFLPGPLRARDQSDSFFPLYLETFSVRLIFPQALPPLSMEGMMDFSQILKRQHLLSFAGPMEVLCAMLTYSAIFKGNFRFFFPDFFVSYGSEYNNIPFMASNRHTLSFQSLGAITPKVFDFCPIMF